MRRVTLQLRVHSEPRQRIWLRQGQVVEAGSSDSADIHIPDDPHVAPIHIAIAHQPMGCFCECLPDGAEMWINHRAVRRKRLKNQDLVCFGGCELEICIEEELATGASGDSPGGIPDAYPSGGQRASGTLEAATDSSMVAGLSPASMGGHASGTRESEPDSLPGNSPIVLTSEYVGRADATESAVWALPFESASLPGGTAPSNPVGHEYASEKLAGEIWRYHAAPVNSVDLETVVGRLAELFDIFLVLSPSTAARLASQRLLPDRMAEINVNMSLIENPDLKATLALLQGASSRHEVMLIASRSGLQELADSLQQHAFTFGRPNIFTMQVSVAHQTLLDQFMLGKVAVLTTESGSWDLYSTVNPSEEYQFLGFDRSPSLMF